MQIKLFVGTSIVLSVVIAAFLWFSNLQMSAFATLVTLLPLFPLGAAVMLSRSSVVFSPIFILYLLALFGNTIRYFVLSLNQDLFYLRPTLDVMRLRDFEIGAEYFAYGIFSLVLGYAVMSVFSKSFAVNFHSNAVTREYQTRPWVALGLSILFAVILVNYLLATGFAADFSAKRTWIDAEGTVYRFGPARFVMGIGLIFCQIMLICAALDRTMNYRWAIILLAVAYVFLYSIGLSKRSTLLLSFLPLILVGVHRLSFKTMLRIVIAIVVILTTLAIITIERKRTVHNQASVEHIPWTRPFVEVFLSGNFSGLVATGISTELISGVAPPMWGKTFVIDPVMQFVPRQIWPDKPEELGGRIREMHQDIGFLPAYYEHGGTAPGLISEAWLNFRVPGIFLVMFLYGNLCRVLYDCFRHRWRYAFLSSAVYMCYLPIFTLNWFGGHTARLVIMSVSFGLAAVLVSFALKKRKVAASRNSIEHGQFA